MLCQTYFNICTLRETFVLTPLIVINNNKSVYYYAEKKNSIFIINVYVINNLPNVN